MLWLLESRKIGQCGWKLVTVCQPLYTGSKTKERVGKSQVADKRYAQERKALEAAKLWELNKLNVS